MGRGALCGQLRYSRDSEPQFKDEGYWPCILVSGITVRAMVTGTPRGRAPG